MLSSFRLVRRGFTLVEFLVVIGILGLLLGLILPAVQQARASADRLRCLSNLRQIGLALHGYHDAQGRMPSPNGRRGDPSEMLNWMALILPHVEQGPLWQMSVGACRTTPRPWENPPHVGFATVIPTYVCPLDARLLAPLTDRDGITAAYTSYLGVAGGRGQPGVFSEPGIRLSDIRDGMSQTIMVGERPPPDTLQAGQWYLILYFGTGAFGVLRGPDWAILEDTNGTPWGDYCVGPFRFGPGRVDNPCDRYHFWSLHPSGGNFLFADGSASFFSYSQQPLIAALATRSGGEVVSLGN
jgi:prepilin-type N-terminal cleavage/methylation domain-containing protein/prepilin-type processing-associated H-X9-DG protein